MGIQMGIGNLGSPSIIIKRKFRFTFVIDIGVNQVLYRIPHSYVKVASRPKLEIEEKELHHLNGIEFYPGKGKWNPIDVTYIDVTDMTMTSILDWVNSIYNFNNPVDLWQTEAPGYRAVASLFMWDGCGNLLERWDMYPCFPTNVDFGDVSYAESDEATITLQLRYSKVFYRNFCGRDPIRYCVGCNSNTF